MLQKNVSIALHLYHACFNANNTYTDKYLFDTAPHNERSFAQVTAGASYKFYTELWAQGARESNGANNFVGSEVDHQVDTFHYITQHRTSVGYAQQYYDGMSRAAVEAGISLQFCMSTPRHILATLGLNGVTHARGTTPASQNTSSFAPTLSVSWGWVRLPGVYFHTHMVEY